jgi:hypothetical protein
MPGQTRIGLTLCAIVALPSLVACTGPSTPSRFSDQTGGDVTANVDRNATPGAFGICHGYNCHFHDIARLTDDQWREILNLFAAPSASAAEERDRIGEAVAIVERSVGEQLGTRADRPRSPPIVVDPTQLDCVDESTNTSTTLHMLDNAGLLRWHAVDRPAVRGNPFLLRLIHFTAVVVEKNTNAYYAIDSWFYENGVPPVIVPLVAWRDGYDPKGREH